MIKLNQLPSIKEIRAALDYDPETGHLIWRFGRKYPGTIAGSVTKGGYRNIYFSRREHFLAHRIAWAHYYGKSPTLFIDHINGDKLDNRIRNLREATCQQNARNSKARAASGLKGVYRAPGNPKLWCAEIRLDGKTKRLGTFVTKDEAAAAFAAAARLFHGEFARLA